ncbi:MAG: ATP-binding cassette domain-containing protein [Isosphaeraceae bacterium]
MTTTTRSKPSPPSNPNPAWPRGLPLRLEDVRVRRGDNEILKGINMTFEPTHRYIVVGASGSGKSTLIRLLNRLDDPTEGRLLIGDHPLTSLPIRAVRQGVALVFQAPRPLPGTIAENLLYPFTVRGWKIPKADQLADALDEVGLDPQWLERDASALSGGERQRLALAVALGAEPEILALDEPTSALDPAAARKLADVLNQRAARSGLRTITVTHHREHAPWFGDQGVVLDGGQVVEVGPVREVLARADAAAWASPRSPKEKEDA